VAEGAGADWFVPRVDQIVNHHCQERTYRKGCHDLSAAVRQRMEELTRIEIEEMTVSEISSCLDERGIEAFLRQLMSHQFGKQPPDKSHRQAAAGQEPPQAPRQGLQEAARQAAKPAAQEEPVT
jgi:hypothetical protein